MSTPAAPEWAFAHALGARYAGAPRFPEACDDDEREAVMRAHREVATLSLAMALDERRDLERRVAAAPDAAHRYLERVRAPRRHDDMGHGDFMRANAGHVLRMIAANVRPIAPGRYQASGFHAHPEGSVFITTPSFRWVASNISATRDLHPWTCKGRHLGHLIALAWDCDLSDGILAVVHTIAERCNPT